MNKEIRDLNEIVKNMTSKERIEYLDKLFDEKVKELKNE